MGVKEINGKNYEFVVPDGGWGYMICIGATINLITTSAFITSFGMIFKSLFLELGIDSTIITFFNGLSALCMAISGLVAIPVLRFLSIRQLGLIAVIIYNLGVFCTVFVNSKLAFFFCQGILQSFGNGLIYNLSFTMLNNYFAKRRLLVVSFVQTVIGVSILITPHLIKWSLEMFGFRGTLLLISGVSLQNIIGMTLMQPVEWHMKKISILVPENKENEIKSLLVSEEKPLTSKENTKIINKSLVTENVNNKEKLNIEKPKQKHCGIKNVIIKFVGESLFKTFLKSNASIGMALCMFSEFTFIIMLPQALYAMSWTENDVAWALSLNAIGDLATRVLFIFMNNWLHNVGSHEIYVMGLVISLITRLGMLWSDNMLVIMIFITIMGISRCTISILIPLVVADAVDQTQFSSAMGVLQIIFGLFNLVVGPIIGAIRDLTDSYSTAFYILSSCIGIVIMFWTIELIYKKNKHKRVPKDDLMKA